MAITNENTTRRTVTQKPASELVEVVGEDADQVAQCCYDVASIASSSVIVGGSCCSPVYWPTHLS